MPTAFPTRSNSHQLEELSERFFREMLPRNWVADRPSTDYGIDLRVDAFEADQATGLELLVQLKAAAMASAGEFERVRLRVSTYNMLCQKLQVTMLAKYVESEHEAYWILLRDISRPTTANATFTVRIPKTNRLSAIPWPEIQTYLRSVADRKLATGRDR